MKRNQIAATPGSVCFFELAALFGYAAGAAPVTGSDAQYREQTTGIADEAAPPG